MQFGIHFGTRGPAASAESLKIIATEAEALGFAYIGLSDHVVIANTVASSYPYTVSGRWFAEDSGECLDQITTLSFLAAVTKKIRLLTSVMVLGHRPALLTAKILQTLDILSSGRLTVGVGVGWMAEEIALLSGPPFHDRGKAAEEYIRAFRNLWGDQKPSFSGEYVKFDDLKFFPKPLQGSNLPIWIGGEASPARRRTGQLGNGWYPVGNNPRNPYNTAKLYRSGLEKVYTFAEAVGRDPSEIDTALYVIWYSLGETRTTSNGKRLSFTGSASDIIQDIHEYKAAGLENLVIGWESDNLEETLERMRRFQNEIMIYV